MTRRLLISLAAALFGVGCTLPDIEDLEESRTQNECSEDSECGPGNSCSEGVCRAPESDFDTVLIAVTPSATDSSAAAGLRFLTTVGDFATAPGPLDIDLSLPTGVKGAVVTSEMVDSAECTPFQVGLDGSVAAELTFTPTERPLGLGAKSYSVSTTPTGSEGISHSYAASLPPGDYDVYVEPAQPDVNDPDPTNWCPLAPQLLRGVNVPSAADPSAATQIVVTAEPPASLTVTVRWPSVESTDAGTPAPSLEGWTADMLEPLTGKVISAPIKPLPAADFSTYEGEVQYQFTLFYAQQSGSAMGQELLRLRPPEGTTAPSMVWNREGLEVLQVGEATIDLRDFPSQTVDVEGVVETLGGQPIPASVTISSTEVESLGEGLLASFTVSAQAADDGKFLANLLPGSYRVVAEPAAETGLPATAVEDFQVGTAPTFQAGKVITLEDRGSIGGRVVASIPRSPPVSGAAVHALASPSKAALHAFKTQAGVAPHVPRATNGLTGKDGGFAVEADPGTFDLSVRPAAETGFPWLVRPRVSVPNQGLGRLELPLPVVHRGAVTVGGEPLGSARISVYVYVGGSSEGYVNNPEDADSVLQVAESVADENGQFEILLPASLN